MSWRPLVDGAGRASALATVVELADRLITDDPRDLSFGRGAAGLALCFGELAELLADRSFEERADAMLSHAVDRLPTLARDPSLYGGYVGVAYAYDQLAPRLYEEVDVDANAEIDAQLAVVLAEPARELDLVSGVAGIAIYALGSAGTQRDALVSAAVKELSARAVHGELGVTWTTGQPAFSRPQRHVNLGLAHGVPGIIAALAGASRAGHAGADELLDESVAWLLARPRPFAYWTDSGDDSLTRLAWCYGDAGIAAVLEWVGRATNRPALRAEAIAIGLAAAARDEATSGVVDAGLCHGSAGLLHIFNRLWQATGDERFAVAARTWLDRTLAFGVDGLGGVVADGAVPPPYAGLLEGAGGVALALAAAVGTREPTWDRALGLSPPRSGTDGGGDEL